MDYEFVAIACSIGKSYDFADFGVFPEVFSGTIRPENAVRMRSAQLDALFRIKKPVSEKVQRREPA